MPAARKAAGSLPASRHERYRRIVSLLADLGVSEVRLAAIADAYFTRGGRWPKPPARGPRDLALRDLERVHLRAHALWDEGACPPFTLDAEIACQSSHRVVSAVAAAARAVRAEFTRETAAALDWVDPERPEMDRDHIFETVEYLFMEEEQSRRAHPEWVKLRGRLTQKGFVFAMLVKAKEQAPSLACRAEVASSISDRSLDSAYKGFKSAWSEYRTHKRRSVKVR